MKTQNAEKPILSFKRLAYTVAVIAAIAFLNCHATGATDYYAMKRLVHYADNMPVDAQSRFQANTWMLNFQYEFVWVLIRHRILRDYGEIGHGSVFGPQPASKPPVSPARPSNLRNKGGSNLPVEL